MPTALPSHIRESTLTVVPAHNEAGNVGPLVEELRRLFPGLAVVVIDDASGDGTGDEARNAGAAVLRLACNLGIAGAVQAGFRYAVAREYRFVVRLDGDGQHDPGFIPEILAPLAAGKCDLVIGSRFLDEGGYRSSTARRLGIRFFTAFLRLFTGYRITDPTSGFIGTNRKTAEFLAEHLPEDYPEIETILAAWKCRFQLQEVPVGMRRRERGRSSITLLGSIYYVIAVSLGMVVGLFKSRPEAGR